MLKLDGYVQTECLLCRNLEDTLVKAADKNGLYVPSGALWGGDDIRKMSDLGTLKVGLH